MFMHSVGRVKDEKFTRFVGEAKDTRSILIFANFLGVVATNDMKFTQNVIGNYRFI